MPKTPALPLKNVLGALDKKQKKWYTGLNDEQKKAFSAWMMMRYASSVQGQNAAHYILMVNEFVNQNFSDVSKHPELQWLLMSLCGSGRVEFHPYIKPPNARKKKSKVQDLLSEMLPHLKNDELDLLMEINEKEVLKEYFKSNGYDDKTIKDIFGK